MAEPSTDTSQWQPPAGETMAEDADKDAPAAAVAGYDPQDYPALAKQAITGMLEAAELSGMPTWEKVKEIGKGASVISVYTRVDRNSGLRCVLGKSHLPYTRDQIFAQVSNYANWKTWDPLLKVSEQLPLTDKLTVIHIVIDSIVWPMWPRELVYLETRDILEDGSAILCSRNCEHPKFPGEPKKNVLSFLHGGGWHMKPDGDKGCNVTYFMHVDPKIKVIPQWVLDMASVRFPGIIDKVRAQCKKAYGE